MEQLSSAALGLHVLRTPNDPPEWHLIRPRPPAHPPTRDTARRRRRR